MRRRVPLSFSVLFLLAGFLAGSCASSGADPPAAGAGAECLECHATAGSVRSVHERVQGGCAACHGDAPHEQAVDPEAHCGDCHDDVRRSFLMPFGHELAGLSPAGGLRCSDCHEPHGPRPRRIRPELAVETCIGCHAEEGGPFIFFHAVEADRNRGCLACHEPHGSANKRALTTPVAWQLCLSCHGPGMDDHNLDPRFAFRDCMQCHNRIHGSDWSHILDR